MAANLGHRLLKFLHAVGRLLAPFGALADLGGDSQLFGLKLLGDGGEGKLAQSLFGGVVPEDLVDLGGELGQGEGELGAQPVDIGEQSAQPGGQGFAQLGESAQAGSMRRRCLLGPLAGIGARRLSELGIGGQFLLLADESGGVLRLEIGDPALHRLQLRRACGQCLGFGVASLLARGRVLLVELERDAIVRQFQRGLDPLQADGLLAQFLDSAGFGCQVPEVAQLLVEAFQIRRGFVQGVEGGDDAFEDVGLGFGEQALEELVVVAGVGGDLAVGLGHGQQPGDLAEGALAAEQSSRDFPFVALDVGVVAAGGLEVVADLLSTGGIEFPIPLDPQGNVLERAFPDDAPAPDLLVHRVDFKPDRVGGSDAVGPRDLQGRIGDPARRVQGAGLHIVAHDDALRAASPRAGASHARGGVELQVLAGGEHVVNGIEHGGLAGAVVPEQEQMAAIGHLDGLVDEVVPVDQADASDGVGGGGGCHWARSPSGSAAVWAVSPSQRERALAL